jgi:hypothetical protein
MRYSIDAIFGEETAQLPQSLTWLGARKDSATNSTGQDWQKAVLTVAERGRGADILGVRSDEITEGDPRFWTGEKAWPQIKRHMIDEHRTGVQGPEEIEEEVDVYADPEESLPWEYVE